MATVTTSIENIFIKIVWVAPNDNSAPITSYEILIKESGGTYTAETTYCNG